MTLPKYAGARTDGLRIAPTIREIVRLMVEEGWAWHRAADEVGLSRARARRALEKPHVIAYRREQKKVLLDLLSVRVPHKLNQLMDSANAAAAVRATLAIEELSSESRSSSTRRISTGGIVIVLGAQQAALPVCPVAAMPMIEHAPTLDEVETTDDGGAT